MTGILLELLRVVGYGGLGALVGFLFGVRFNDGHRLTEAVLAPVEEHEAAPLTDEKGRDRVMRLLVILMMAMMLLTGVVWLVNDRANDQQRSAIEMQQEQLCETTADVIKSLKNRTRVYREEAWTNTEAWRGLKRVLMRDLGLPDTSPLIVQIDTTLKKNEVYRRHLTDNPYPEPPEECRVR